MKVIIDGKEIELNPRENENNPTEESQETE